MYICIIPRYTYSNEEETAADGGEHPKAEAYNTNTHQSNNKGVPLDRPSNELPSPPPPPPPRPAPVDMSSSREQQSTADTAQCSDPADHGPTNHNNPAAHPSTRRGPDQSTDTSLGPKDPPPLLTPPQHDQLGSVYPQSTPALYPYLPGGAYSTGHFSPPICTTASTASTSSFPLPTRSVSFAMPAPRRASTYRLLSLLRCQPAATIPSACKGEGLRPPRRQRPAPTVQEVPFACAEAKGLLHGRAAAVRQVGNTRGA